VFLLPDSFSAEFVSGGIVASHEGLVAGSGSLVFAAAAAALLALLSPTSLFFAPSSLSSSCKSC
jgi:hypothetical protein